MTADSDCLQVTRSDGRAKEVVRWYPLVATTRHKQLQAAITRGRRRRLHDATLPSDAAGKRAQEWFRVGRASRLTITATIARPASIVTLGIGAAGCGPVALVTAISSWVVGDR